jgi:hypothetical protein
MGRLWSLYLGLIGIVAVAFPAVLLPLSPQAPSHDTARNSNGEANVFPVPSSSFRVPSPIKLLEPTWKTELLPKLDQPRFASEETSISHVRLVEGDYLVADWRDGRWSTG